GHYRSVIVAHKDSTIQSMPDIDPTRHQIAVNEIGSFSGQIILSHMLLGHGALAFPHQTLTGGHALSAKAVAEERADLTALDEISYALIKRNDPKTAKNLRIIGHSASHPGLAFVTSGQTDAATLALLRARLLQFFETQSGQALAEVLDLRGATYIDPAAYKPLCDL
ncbi:MAG: PhnD/SsuA/transferrin family substrate-binding protein, partial [Paracoccaceae bacterium]|nr:PhnD/SsuA/transferrin family substrate-binding protein [Paracoccaceae bacterium]